MIGPTVESIPLERPAIIFVAAPVWLSSAILFTWLYFSDVNTSDKNPIAIPTIIPTTIQIAAFIFPKNTFERINDAIRTIAPDR